MKWGQVLTFNVFGETWRWGQVVSNLLKVKT
jgi:hypothetical protein